MVLWPLSKSKNSVSEIMYIVTISVWKIRRDCSINSRRRLIFFFSTIIVVDLLINTVILIKLHLLKNIYITFITNNILKFYSFDSILKYPLNVNVPINQNDCVQIKYYLNICYLN